MADQYGPSHRSLQFLGASSPPSDAAATREGQREIVAATLAAGVMAANGKPMNEDDAVALMQRLTDAIRRARAA